MPIVPRVGEYVKFLNTEMGDYFPWKVTEITYRESGGIEISTELLNDISSRGYSFEGEEEFDEYVKSYLSEGWISKRGIHQNNRFARSNAGQSELTNSKV